MSDVPLHQQLQAHAGGLVRLKLAGHRSATGSRALQWNDRIGLLLGGMPSAPNATRQAWVFVLIDGSPQSILVLRDEVEFIGGNDV